MRRVFSILIIVAGVSGLFAGTASAHVRVVDPPGVGEPAGGWVGSPADGIPGVGEGLVLGGADGQTTLSPSHAGGLNTACLALRAGGQAAVDIFGPPTPAGCNHGS